MSARPCCCTFCGRNQDAVALLFKAAMTATDVFICDGCVGGFCEIVAMHRVSPELAAAAIAELNKLGRERHHEPRD